MTFSHHPIKDEIKKIGVNNQGTLLIYLYALLVVPKEITESKYKKDQDILNTLVQSRALRVHTTYSSDQLGVDFFRHIRNAIAHLRVEFGPGETVTFKDFFHGDEFEVVFPLSHIGEFLTELQRIHRSYVCDIRNRVESD